MLVTHPITRRRQSFIESQASNLVCESNQAETISLPGEKRAAPRGADYELRNSQCTLVAYRPGVLDFFVQCGRRVQRFWWSYLGFLCLIYKIKTLFSYDIRNPWHNSTHPKVLNFLCNMHFYSLITRVHRSREEWLHQLLNRKISLALALQVAVNVVGKWTSHWPNHWRRLVGVVDGLANQASMCPHRVVSLERSKLDFVKQVWLPWVSSRTI